MSYTDGKYILDGKKAVPCSDLIKWGKWFETAGRKVARTKIGEIEVSTAFLGIDHGFDGGTPLLFETMVFGGPLDEEMERYTTWQDAEEGHKHWVQKVEAAIAEATKK